MTDTDVRVPEPEPPHGRFRRMMHWMRDYESDRARRFYAAAGIWSSRIYALLVVIIVLMTVWAEPPAGIDAYMVAIWGFLSRWYLWYQGKAILAYPIIEEQHANRDQNNSFLPLVSVLFLLILWVIMQWLFYSNTVAKPFSFGFFGWMVMLIATWDATYDLRVNNRMMFILSRVPSRVEFGAPRSTDH